MFSIIAPLDSGRLRQFKETKLVYDSYPQEKEFIIPTRNFGPVEDYLVSNDLMKGVRLFHYTVDKGFNVSKALNIGVRNSSYDQIIITSPEVKPITPVLDQLSGLLGQNVVCQVFDEAEDGSTHSMVNEQVRFQSPAMYFLAMFNKKDIETINGWDEEFMRGYAYEDDDFGARFNRAGLSFSIHEEIQALHQYHPRGETIAEGTAINYGIYSDNNNAGIIRPQKGLSI